MVEGGNPTNVIFSGDVNGEFYVDEHGTRWSLSCEWPSKATPVPDCLQINEARRRKAWEGVKLTDQWTGGTQEEWKIKQDQIQEQRALLDRERVAVALGRLKDKHPGERYDRKTRAWVKITAPVSREVEPPAWAVICPTSGATCTLCTDGACMMKPIEGAA